MAPDAVRKEEGYASWELVPVNQKANIPPATVAHGSDKASKSRDSPMAAKLKAEASDSDGSDDGTMRIRANPSKDRKMGPVLPLRAKQDSRYPIPYDEQFEGGDTWLEDSD